MPLSSEWVGDDYRYERSRVAFRVGGGLLSVALVLIGLTCFWIANLHGDEPNDDWVGPLFVVLLSSLVILPVIVAGAIYVGQGFYYRISSVPEPREIRRNDPVDDV